MASEIGPWSRACSKLTLPRVRKHQQVRVSMVMQPGLSNITELSESGKKHHQADSLSFFFSLDVGVEFWFLTPIPRNGWPHHLGEPAFSANLSWKDSPPTVPLPDTGPSAWTSQRSAGALPEFGASLHTSPLPALLWRMTHLDSVPCRPRWVAHLRGHVRVDEVLSHTLWSSFICLAWLLRKQTQENLVTGIRLKKKKPAVRPERPSL